MFSLIKKNTEMEIGYVLILPFLIFSCNNDALMDSESENPEEQLTELYFPSSDNEEWDQTDASELSWNTEKIPELMDLLEENGTRAFIILVNGKIAIEAYFGKDLLNLSDFNQSKQWYWASAGKTLTSFLIGKAQEDNFLSIHDKSSDYLGNNWTDLSKENEDQITIRHQLTMTTGLDDMVSDNHDFSPENLIYKADAGSRWAYHNAPYTILDQVIESAVNEEYEAYFNRVLRDKIGMDGNWVWLNNDHVYFSTARSMVRFGLLISHNGNWDGESIFSDQDYLTEMSTPSQNINNSYGYLWWLNGKDNYMLPGLQITFPGAITPEAPADMYSGIGKNGQYISVIPSLDMVMFRMGENPDEVPVPLLFQKDIWKIMNQIIE